MPFQDTLGGILFGEGIAKLIFPQNLSSHIKLFFCLL